MKKKVELAAVSCLIMMVLVLPLYARAEPEEEKAVEPKEMILDPATGEMVEKPQYGGTINTVIASDPTSWDNWRWNGGGDTMMAYVYEILSGGDWSTPRSENDFTSVYIPPKNVIGFSAESWEQLDDLTYKLKIREGMRFQDKPPVNGREVVAADVKWSIDRINGLGEFEEPSPHTILAYGWESLEEVELVDKYTFILRLSEPKPMFPEAWGMERQPFIMPHEVVDEYGNDFPAERVVGSGPWMLEDFVSASIIKFDKFPNYYGRDEKYPDNQIPYADHFNILIIADESTRLSALRTGKIDWMSLAQNNASQMWKTAEQLKWKQKPSVSVGARIRVDLEPYKDIRVRKAMQMAIDMDEMNDALYGGTGNTFPMMINSVFKDLYTPLDELPAECQEAFRYNPEKAKALLAEAGYPDGFKQTMTMSSTASSFYTEPRDAFVSYWEAIGIETEIDVLESAAYSSFVNAGEHEVVMMYLGGYWMPVAVLDHAYGGQKSISWNYGNVDDPVFNKMVDAIRSNPDPAERERLLKEANAYGTCQFFQPTAPEQVSFNFWQPWIKSYDGEFALHAYFHPGSIYARVWVDQDLKEEMTGTRD
jgi:peptide/nickel transport system substrate-binding protein